MDASSLLAYFVTCVLIELTPGPNMGFLALVGATRGRKLGFALVAGIATGLLVVGLLAAFGVATLIDRSVFLYESLHYGGGAYLLWLAFQQWREASQTQAESQSMTPQIRRYFRYGLTVNLLNPKAALFYIAVLPTYLHAAQIGEPASLMMAASLTLIYVLVATLIHGMIVLFASQFQTVLQRDGLRQKMARIFAVLLAIIAVWMVISSSRS